MVFSSITFLFYFLPVLLLVYFLAPNVCKNYILLAASLLFYAWGEPVYIVLMLLSILVNFLFGLLFEEGLENHASQKMLSFHLFLAVGFNVLILFYFKYAGWLISILNHVTGGNIPAPNLSLPIGISFYTFQALSYVVDVYLRKTKAQKSLVDFALYITMFPQLIAGPIVRYTDIEKSLHERKTSLSLFGFGAQLFVRGLVKKVLLANTFGSVFSGITSGSELGALSAWLGAICYSLQLYFDFSGYSDMAIGLGRMFGFSFPMNFNHPYIARSVTDFWRRWHISLSSWFREYVYIPLGGNRCGVGKQLRNLFVVWALTGLWHGANTNFLLWGLYYFFWLSIEKFVLKDFLARHHVIGHVYTILIFTVGWVIFAFTDMHALGQYLASMIGLHGVMDSAFLYYLQENALILIAGILCCTGLPQNILQKVTVSAKWLSLFLYTLFFLLCVSSLVYDSYNPFLYFRF